MGHYDDIYDEEEDRRKRQLWMSHVKTMLRIEAAYMELKSAVGQFGDHQLNKPLDDFRREFVLWQFDNHLLVKDPEITFELLKNKG